MKKVFYKNTCSVGTHLYLIAITLLFLVVCLTSCAPTAGLFAGGKWQSGGLQHQHIRSLAVDPNNPQIIYAGDAQDGVFVSTNAGMNWGYKSTGLTLPSLRLLSMIREKNFMLQRIMVFLLVLMLQHTG